MRYLPGTLADRPDFTDPACRSTRKAIRSRTPCFFSTGQFDRHSLFPGTCTYADVAVVSGLKDYFETTRSYDNVLQLNMGLTYVRIFAALVNVVLESLTTPEQRTRAEPFRHRMAKNEENMLVMRVPMEIRAQTE